MEQGPQPTQQTTNPASTEADPPLPKWVIDEDDYTNVEDFVSSYQEDGLKLEQLPKLVFKNRCLETTYRSYAEFLGRVREKKSNPVWQWVWLAWLQEPSLEVTYDILDEWLRSLPECPSMCNAVSNFVTDICKEVKPVGFEDLGLDLKVNYLKWVISNYELLRQYRKSNHTLGIAYLGAISQKIPILFSQYDLDTITKRAPPSGQIDSDGFVGTELWDWATAIFRAYPANPNTSTGSHSFDAIRGALSTWFGLLGSWRKAEVGSRVLKEPRSKDELKAIDTEMKRLITAISAEDRNIFLENKLPNEAPGMGTNQPSTPDIEESEESDEGQAETPGGEGESTETETGLNHSRYKEIGDILENNAIPGREKRMISLEGLSIDVSRATLAEKIVNAWRKQGFGIQILIEIGPPHSRIYRLFPKSQVPLAINLKEYPDLGDKGGRKAGSVEVRNGSLQVGFLIGVAHSKELGEIESKQQFFVHVLWNDNSRSWELATGLYGISYKGKKGRMWWRTIIHDLVRAAERRLIKYSREGIFKVKVEPNDDNNMEN
ncbi:hypothetical protein TWF970_010763 [Orbilia oligospora]|uniref:Uncharacterized protein n=1 Tax=Orbilia oligospora TaxID=2813651 RepID=A0A7C8VAI3_ORBOL|nr:hypothetical protein TWF970_010763 [Orbilia oligospora]